MNTVNPQAMSLQARYGKLQQGRTHALERARIASSLTIPSLIPPEGFNGSTLLPDPYQSVGARGVNNLASRMLLTSFPPNEVVFRLTVPDSFMRKMEGRGKLREEVEKALSDMEKRVQHSLETHGVRPSAFEVIRHLLVAGNVLLYSAPQGGLKSYGIDKYCVKRSPTGEPLEIVLEDRISWIELPEEAQTALRSQGRQPKDDNTDDNFSLYTGIMRRVDKWEVWQEVEGTVVPKSKGEYPLKKCPWRALRYITVSGEDYGRGMVEEYLGDLQTLEVLTKAIVKAAAAASKIVFMVRPGSATKAAALNKAESGDFVVGVGEDVSVLQFDKQADMQVAMATRDTIKADLEQAFLLANSIRRNGERVTAEEIRMMATELENTLGGVYSHLAMDMQLPIVQLEIYRMTRAQELPTLPEGIVEPVITTGIEALARNSELERLRAFIADLAQLKQAAEAAQPYISVAGIAQRLATNHNIDTDGLLSTPEEIQAYQQQQAQASAMEQLGAPMVNQAGGIMKERMKAANQPQGGNTE